jgi:hypothetical protein
MNTIDQLSDKCDRLAARYYRLDAGSRERAARDWLQLVRETATKIKCGQGVVDCGFEGKSVVKKTTL